LGGSLLGSGVDQKMMGLKSFVLKISLSKIAEAVQLPGIIPPIVGQLHSVMQTKLLRAVLAILMVFTTPLIIQSILRIRISPIVAQIVWGGTVQLQQVIADTQASMLSVVNNNHI
jgi:hypothetical protein